MRSEVVRRVDHVGITCMATVSFWLWGAGFKGHGAGTFQAGSGLGHQPRGGCCEILSVTMETRHPDVRGGDGHHVINACDDDMIPRKCGR